ncbi:ABC transporter E family member 2-like [Pyrus ussuriensis x Pyrus communis]|uniref:ABC transporter E family member 2-like n=1 Tax=Pyrus ussuriensis x Pyrus communis TaxID=2448454 RepID=A0A5N5GHC2_9ROSA|nr:ABC transporter E family member 2-like [Pyrus ussuriensis x Pyrus communis]
MANRSTRIAILNTDKCKPNKCNQESKTNCPPVHVGKKCIEVTPTSKSASISEELCTGCGICVHQFKSSTWPKALSKETTHRYGPNHFKLHRLQVPRPGEVLGLVGTNGIGKSTALKILSGSLKPNLGRFNNPPDWQEILTYFRGSELQNYFIRLLQDKLKAIIKPQYVDHIPKVIEGSVGEILKQKDERGMMEELCIDLELYMVLDRNVGELSSGELHRYMFDEPSSYLDVKQRLKAARVIRSLIRPDSYVIVVEHDLSVLDYLSDHICCLYGKPDAYGVVTLPFSVREGINIFLSGFVSETPREIGEETETYNGTGKTTFIRMLAGILKPDADLEMPQLQVSYKPQKISPKSKLIVNDLLQNKIRSSYTHQQFVTDVMKPLQIEDLLDQKVKKLSGGELQRVALCLCLGQPADIYLIDKPSAYLDSEQRIVAAKVIKRFILHSKKSAFVVENDFIMATYLADRVIVYDGKPGVDCTAISPQSLLTGMNLFLFVNVILLIIAPRINKLNSTKDTEQKAAGTYYYLDD